MARHASRAAQVRQRRRVAAAGVSCLILGGAAIATASLIKNDSTAACNNPPTVQVAVPDEMYELVFKAANQLEQAGVCAQYNVKDRSSSEVDTSIQAGGTNVPDVWISDSDSWVRDASAKLGAGWLTQGKTFATSPVVLGIPASLKSNRAVRDGLSWRTVFDNTLPLSVQDPAANSATQAAVTAASDVTTNHADRTTFLSSIIRLSRSMTGADGLATKASKGAETARAFPISEQQLLDFNAAHPAAALTPGIPTEGAPQLQYSWVTPVRATPAPSNAINELYSALTSGEGMSRLAEAGFRVPGGQAPAGSPVPTDVKLMTQPSPKQAVSAVKAWQDLAKDARMLVLVDGSGSMADPDANGQSRMSLFQATALGALNGIPQTTQIGAWMFSTKLRAGSHTYEDLSGGVSTIADPAYKAKLEQTVRTVPQQIVARNGDTPLYDVINSAFDYMTKSYNPNFVNSVVVFTDGQNDNPYGGLTLPQLLAKLKGRFDPLKPVKIVTIALGTGADPAALKAIATSTDGLSYVTKTPSQITEVFIDAFLHRS